MLYYRNEIKDTFGYTYSVDRLRASFRLMKCEVDYISALFSQDDVRIKIDKPCLSDFRYRYLIHISGERSTTLTVGLCLNSYSSDDKLRGFVDFNPNKMDDTQIAYIDRLQACCSDFNISRIDVACDVPYPRECLRIVREGNRPYQFLECSLNDFTEYLGTRNTVGFVKVYNKTSESKLDYDLTRIEITVEPFLSSYRDSLPTVQIRYNKQLEMADFSVLSDTDRVIIDLLNEVSEDKKNFYFRRLGYDKKKKLKPFLYKYIETFEPDYNCVHRVINTYKHLEK